MKVDDDSHHFTRRQATVPTPFAFTAAQLLALPVQDEDLAKIVYLTEQLFHAHGVVSWGFEG